METLKASVRDMSVKAKKLRREGFLPASISGREMKESLSITISEKDAMAFMKKHNVGSQAALDVDGTEYDVLLKSADFDPLKHQFLEMTFQQLVADEKMKTKSEIFYENEELAQGFMARTLQEVEYKAYPADLVDRIVIDVSKYPIGTNLTVADLELAKNPKIDFITPLDTVVLHISAHQHIKAEDEETEETDETTTETEEA